MTQLVIALMLAAFLWADRPVAAIAFGVLVVLAALYDVGNLQRLLRR